MNIQESMAINPNSSYRQFDVASAPGELRLVGGEEDVRPVVAKEGVAEE